MGGSRHRPAAILRESVSHLADAAVSRHCRAVALAAESRRQGIDRKRIALRSGPETRARSFSALYR